MKPKADPAKELYEKFIREFTSPGENFRPAYLGDTLYAVPALAPDTAGIRVVLMRLGITHAIPHLILGLFCGFFFPWLLSLWSESFAPLHFLFYPKRKKKTATA